MLNSNKIWRDGKVIFALGEWYVGIDYDRLKECKQKHIKSAKIANEIIRGLTQCQKK